MALQRFQVTLEGHGQANAYEGERVLVALERAQASASSRTCRGACRSAAGAAAAASAACACSRARTIRVR